MNGLDEIRARRTELLARAAVDRERIGHQMERWLGPISLADRGVRIARTLQRHPEWLVGAAALLVVLRPRRTLAWARRGFVVWRTWRWAAGAVRELTGDRTR